MKGVTDDTRTDVPARFGPGDDSRAPMSLKPSGRFLIAAAVALVGAMLLTPQAVHGQSEIEVNGPGSVVEEGTSVETAAIETAAGEAPAYTPPGDSVVEVRIEGNVTIPSDAIAKYIKTRPGRAVTQKQIRDDVRSLYGTRWFFSVEPRYRQTETGQVLVFRVLERPVVNRVEYQGNKKIKQKVLAAETGLKIGSPFDVSANREAARRLETYYHEKGFPFATVKLAKGESQDDRDVVFAVTEGPKVKVTSVKYDGNEDFSAGVLNLKLKTKKAILWTFGGKFDPASIEEDKLALKEYYHSLGYFEVKIDHELVFSDDKSRVQIRYKIEEGPRFRVRNVKFAGNNIFNEQQLRSGIELVEGEFFNSRPLNKDVTNIKDRYSEQGRLFARVEAVPVFLETPGEADLLYRIDEDRVYRIRRVNVHIQGDNPHTKRAVALNQFLVSPGDLADMKKIQRTERRLGGSQIFERGPGVGPRIDVIRVQKDDPVSASPDFRGQSPDDDRPQTRSTPPRTSSSITRPAAPAHRRASLPTLEGGGHSVVNVFAAAPAARPGTAHIRQARKPEPTRRPASRPEQAGRPEQAKRSSGTMSQHTRLPVSQSGVPVSQSGVNEPIDNPLGFKLVSIESETDADVSLCAENLFGTREPDAFTVLPDPDPPRRPRTRILPDGTVVRAQSFDQPGPEPFNPLFESPPSPDPLAGSDFDEVDLNVFLNEARTGRLMFGVGVNSDAGVVGSIVLSEQNFDLFNPPRSLADVVNGTAFRGGGQRFRAEAVPGSVVSRYLVSWTDPYFLNTDNSLGVSGFYYNRFFPDWDETRGGGRVTIGRQLTPQWSVSGALRLESIDIDNPDQPTPLILQQALGSSFLSTVKASVAHDTRDSAFLPGEGHFAQLSYEQAFGDFSYPRFEGEASQFFTVFSRPDGGGRHIVTLKGNVGWTGDDTPIFERFFAGGFQTFRGFAFRGVTPRQLDVGIGGQFMAIGTVEYMFPLLANESLQLVAFSDFGTVEEDVSFDHFRATAGLGLRVTVPALGPVPLAFDWAFPITTQDFDDERIFSFYVGATR